MSLVGQAADGVLQLSQDRWRIGRVARPSGGAIGRPRVDALGDDRVTRRPRGQIDASQLFEALGQACAWEEHQLARLLGQPLDQAGAEPERGATVLTRERASVERAGGLSRRRWGRADRAPA